MRGGSREGRVSAKVKQRCRKGKVGRASASAHVVRWYGATLEMPRWT